MLVAATEVHGGGQTFFSKWDACWGRVFGGWGIGCINQGFLGLSNGNEVYLRRSSYLCSLDTDQRLFWAFAWYVAERTQ